MKSLKELLELLAKCLQELEACAKARDEAKDEKAKTDAEAAYKAKASEFDGLEKKVEEAKAFALRAKAVRDLGELAKTIPPGTIAPDGAPPPKSAPAQAKNPDTEEQAHQAAVCDWFNGKSLSGEQHELLAPRQKWEKLDGGGIRLSKRQADRLVYGAKAIPTLAASGEGANLVATMTIPQILMYAPSAIRLFDRVTRVPARGGTIQWPKLTQAAPGAEDGANEWDEVGAVAVAWTAEGAEKTATEGNFEQLSISPYELSAYTEMSRTLIGRSVIDIERLIDTLFRAAITQKLDRALINGNGVGKPTGILQTSGIGNVARAVDNQVSYADLVSVEHDVAPQLREGAVWLLNDSALEYIKKLLDSANRPVFNPTMGDRPYPTILGYPYITNLLQPSLGTDGDVIFLNPGQYICAVEEEVVIANSDHYKFRSGLRAYAVWMKVGGKLVAARAAARLNVHS